MPDQRVHVPAHQVHRGGPVKALSIHPSQHAADPVPDGFGDHEWRSEA